MRVCADMMVAQIRVSLRGEVRVEGCGGGSSGVEILVGIYIYRGNGGRGGGEGGV